MSLYDNLSFIKLQRDIFLQNKSLVKNVFISDIMLVNRVFLLKGLVLLDLIRVKINNAKTR
jgi:hypothetical protein